MDESSAPTAGQRRALDDLGEICDAGPQLVEIVRTHPLTEAGWLPIEVSIATNGLPKLKNGAGPAVGPRADMRQRERFIINVPPRFPFEVPQLWVTHDRFADLPHVQWRHYLCLYRSPATEWQPSDGMFGFLERLFLWIERAAAGTLDPVGEPLHPPVAYTSRSGGTVVIRADIPPSAATLPTLGYAIFRQVNDDRVDLVGWVCGSDADSLFADPTLERLAELSGGVPIPAAVCFGLAVLLADATPFEFPQAASELLDLLALRGVNRGTILDGLARVTYLNQRLSQVSRAARRWLRVVAGTPMRRLAGGEQRQHLTVWRLPADTQQATDLLDTIYSPVNEIAATAQKIRDLVGRWLEAVQVDWARVFDVRPEVSQRRDHGSPLAWAMGRKVMVIGCGAIGGHVAEHLVRAGAARLVLIDHGVVSPGILVRQPYGDADVGRLKGNALPERLHHARGDVKIDVKTLDALRIVLDEDRWPTDVDLIIDAAANPAVTAAIERRRRDTEGVTPPILSLMLGHTASRGIVTLAPSGYTGAGADLLRKLKLSTLSERGLRAFAEDFFPDPPRTTYFEPEPGCSEPTFVGSDAEVAALSASLLLQGLRILRSQGDAPTPTASTAHAVLVDLGLDGCAAITRELEWPADAVLNEPGAGLQVRIAPRALAEMRAECRLMRRRATARTETGGILLGEIDDACGVAWITTATGPPPDSQAFEHLFVCGVEGVEKRVKSSVKATGGAEQFLGHWHSHPSAIARPSDLDETGMRKVLLPIDGAPRRAFLLIIGGSSDIWSSWLDTEGNDGTSGSGARQLIPELYVRHCRRLPRVPDDPTINRDADPQSLHGIAPPGANETRRWPPALQSVDRASVYAHGKHPWARLLSRRRRGGT
jgi:integrative and conjugative element protein (TIGR02256 family)